MGSPELPLPLNASLSEDGGDPVKLFLCWVRQSCDDCISMSNDVDCSWCPYSSICVPNPSPKYPLLAPIDHPNVCPMGAKERWELRARGLGCNVSTRNFLSVSVAIVSSFVLMGILALLITCLKAVIRSCSQERSRRERGYLGVVLFRGWDGRSDDSEDRYVRRQGRGQGRRDEVVDERSSLLRRESEGV